MKAQVIIALLLISSVLSSAYVTNCVNDVKAFASNAGKVKSNHFDINAIIQLGKDADHAVTDCAQAYHAARSPQCQKVITTFINTVRARGHKLRDHPRSALGDLYAIVASGNVVGTDCLGA